jgi:hypothetical protein
VRLRIEGIDVIVTSDAPGLTTTRTEVFDRRHAPGPLWPKDPGATWP